MTTLKQPIHVNTGMLEAHAKRLIGFADRLDRQRGQLTNAVGMITWNTSIPNHGSISGAYNRTIGLMKSQAEGIRRAARNVARYAQVMEMIDAAFKVAPFAAGMPWRGIPSATGGEGYGPLEGMKSVWDTFDPMVSLSGLNSASRVIVFPGVTTIKLPMTYSTTEWVQYGGERVPVFRAETVWVDHAVAQTLGTPKPVSPWLSMFDKVSMAVAIVALPYEVYKIFRPSEQAPGSKQLDQLGHVGGASAAAMTILGLTETVAFPIAAGTAIGVPIGTWRLHTFERWDEEGRGPITSTSDAVQVVVNPIKAADTALYAWYSGWKWAGQKYYGDGSPAQQIVDRYQHSAAIGATLRELEARYPGMVVDRSVAGQISVVFPSGEHVVINR